ncbi:hypothetical protein FZEAL_231 [Fusarium zealandicum]|uniref:Uncharacterized protein n=1 Tax=Fusarium zealandicum TaxID=1053134 RepID=A0A8H4UVT5_9HYPO|nr:hypothetical protein FZEAL_231 [Fusarium zealandicum]
MASRLLDDSTTSLQGRGEDHSPNKRRATTPSASYSFGGDPAISPLVLPPPLEKPPASSETQVRNSRVGKSSPRMSLGAPRRAATTRTRGDVSQKRNTPGLQRPLGPSRAHSLEPLKFHPTNNLKVSSSVPLSTVDGNVRHRVTERQRTGGTSAEHSDAKGINQKLEAMLAATDALKPSPLQPVNSSSSRLTRMVPSKVFSKVSSAWERLHPKPSLPEMATGSKVPLGENNGDKLARWDSAPAPSPNNLSPISTIEIRLNEGDNLNKRKVQRIVGGQVTRKPVADDGKSLRSGKSLDDPFSEVGGWRTPTTFESRLKMGVDKDGSIIPPLPCSPFETEKGFDINIEDRILNSSPVGSSTPRVRFETVSASSSDYSPTVKTITFAQRKGSLLQIDTSLELGQGTLIQSGRPKLTIADLNKEALVDSVNEARKAWERIGREANALGPKRVKKHPSPSKEALENLELAFRQYADFEGSEASINDLDELAADFAITSPSLKNEKKRLSFNRLSVSNMENMVGMRLGRIHPRPGSSSSVIPLGRVPNSSENPTNLYKEIRLAPPYRPAGFSPHDVDELH